MTRPAILLHYPKYLRNLAMIARACGCYGIEELYFTGDRLRMDVKLPRELRMQQNPHPLRLPGGHPSQFPDHVPVAVEFRQNAEPLPAFVHPSNALYVFGPEDGSLPPTVLKACHRFVVIPTMHCLSLPIAVATVLYDRATKDRL